MADASLPVVGPPEDPGRYQLRRARSVGGERQEWDASLASGPARGSDCRVLLIRPASEADVLRWRRFCNAEVGRLRSFGTAGLVQITAVFEAADPLAPNEAMPVFVLATGPVGRSGFAAWAANARARGVEASLAGFRDAARALDALHSVGEGGAPSCFGIIKVDDVVVDEGRVQLPVLALLDDFPSNGVAIDRWAFSELVYWGVTGRRPDEDRTPAALHAEIRDALGTGIPDAASALLSRLFTAEVQAAPMSTVVEDVLTACRTMPPLETPMFDEGDARPRPSRPTRRPRHGARTGANRGRILVLVVAAATVVTGVLALQFFQSRVDSSSKYARAVVTEPTGLIVRSGAGRGFDRIASFDQGATVEILCHRQGETVSGAQGQTATWYQLVSGGFVTGAYLSILSNPGMPGC